MSNTSFMKKDDDSISSESSPKRISIINTEMNKRLEKENEEIKLENKKLRYIIEEKNQEQIKMLKKEIVRQRKSDRTATKYSVRILILGMIVYIVMNLLFVVF